MDTAPAIRCLNLCYLGGRSLPLSGMGLPGRLSEMSDHENCDRSEGGFG